VDTGAMVRGQRLATRSGTALATVAERSAVAAIAVRAAAHLRHITMLITCILQQLSLERSQSVTQSVMTMIIITR
jgi:hypothetical protein